MHSRSQIVVNADKINEDHLSSPKISITIYLIRNQQAKFGKPKIF